MASTSDSGHAKNVANYEKLIAGVTALGTVYNPSKANLKLEALNSQLVATMAAVNAMHNAEIAHSKAIGKRDAAFKDLSKLVTRISNALKASDTTPQVKDNALTIVRKLQGRRATPKATEAEKLAATEKGKQIVEISASQTGFDYRLDNFGKLVSLVASVPEYMPNEEDLKVKTLQSLLKDLKAIDTEVTANANPLTAARITRNDLLYKPVTGVIPVSSDIKTYIKSVFGAGSPQHKALTSLHFSSPN